MHQRKHCNFIFCPNGSCSYSLDDLWIVSTNQQFAAKSPNDRVWIMRSVFHGPSSSGMIELKTCGNQVPSFQHNQSVYAIRGPNASTEFLMLGIESAP